MKTNLSSLLDQLKSTQASLSLSEIKRGIEKENLRVDANGNLAKTPHPYSLGSALTNPCITTDFSEALPELITRPYTNINELLTELNNINSFVTSNLNQEMLWPASMPCYINDNYAINIANYGSSNIGKMKRIYRQGLWHRYGPMMQTIAGIHYNFSLPDAFFSTIKKLENNHQSAQEYRSAKYMQLIRGFYKNYWILPYLFGASPACMQNSIVQENPQYLSKWLNGCFIGEYSTSLRMSELGYQNNVQAKLKICQNDIKSYAKSLLAATQTPYEKFAKIGVKDGDEYKQLNPNILQIENEFYSPIRPKQIPLKNEMPALALKRRGIEYIEVRCLDLNPLLVLGIDKDIINFMDVFLLTCLLENQTSLSNLACTEAQFNFSQVVKFGRQPNLKLMMQNNPTPFANMADKLFTKLRQVANFMDNEQQTDFVDSIEKQYQKIIDVSKTPAAEILELMQRQNKTHQELMLEIAKQHKDYFSQYQIPASNLNELKHMATASAKQQKCIESCDNISFDDFIADYFAQAAQSKVTG